MSEREKEFSYEEEREKERLEEAEKESRESVEKAKKDIEIIEGEEKKKEEKKTRGKEKAKKTKEGLKEREEEEKRLKNLTLIVYGLQCASIFIGLTLIVGAIINYVKKDDVKGTWLESHFKWQIKTFWVSLILGIVGILTSPFLIGIIVIIADAIYLLYRSIKGFLYCYDNKPMYSQEEEKGDDNKE